jgi:hypothetical protein
MFKKALVLSVALSCGFFLLIERNSALAQYLEWQQTYGGASSDEAQDVRQTSDGGFVIVGSTESFGANNGDVYLVKTDSLGDTLWTRRYGGDSTDYGECVQQTPDGGYIVTGVTCSYGAGWGDVYLIRTDSSGDTLWTRTYGGSYWDEGHFVQNTFDGGYIIAGRTYSTYPTGACDAYFIKTNSTGNTLWTRTYGDTDGFDGAYCVQQTSDSGYIATGFTDPGIRGQRYHRYYVYLIRLESTGDTLWTRTYGGAAYDDWAEWVEETEDLGFIVIGQNASFDPGNFDVWLIRTDEDGDSLWTKTFGGSNDDFGYSGQQTTDGSYIVVGNTASFGVGGTDVYLIKTDSSGAKSWTCTYGGGANDAGLSVRQTQDEGYIVAGATGSFGAGAGDFYLLKMAPYYICGDANGDSVVDVGDITYLTNYLYYQGAEPTPMEAGDANCDGEVDTGDLIYLINYLFMNGAEPCCP